MCFDGTKRLCHIRGKLRKRQWINAQDIILVGLRDYQDQKADVIMKYNSDEARRLKNMGHLPDSVNIELNKTITHMLTSRIMKMTKSSMFPSSPINRRLVIRARKKKVTTISPASRFYEKNKLQKKLQSRKIK